MIQLCYNYGCKKIQQPSDGDIVNLVLAAATGEAAELSDPDEYKVVLHAQ